MVLASKTAPLAGEAVQRPIRNHAALPGEEGLDLGDRQWSMVTVAGHPRGDLVLESQQLFPGGAVPVRPRRAHRLDDRPDQGVVDRLDTVGALQAGGLGGLDVAAHRLAVHPAVRGNGPQPRLCPSGGAEPDPEHFLDLVHVDLPKSHARRLCAGIPTRRSNEPVGGSTARRAGWSHDGQSRWSHDGGRNQVTLVPCSWQATYRSVRAL